MEVKNLDWKWQTVWIKLAELDGVFIQHKINDNSEPIYFWKHIWVVDG